MITLDHTKKQQMLDEIVKMQSLLEKIGINIDRADVNLRPQSNQDNMYQYLVQNKNKWIERKLDRLEANIVSAADIVNEWAQLIEA